jgi:hypothetical protein
LRLSLGLVSGIGVADPDAVRISATEVDRQAESVSPITTAWLLTLICGRD